MSRVSRLRLLNLGRVSPLRLHASYAGLAEAMASDDAAGWLLLARSERGHIALGASQYADAELDLPACRAAGIPVIQRPLGGGTVWVDEHQLCVFFIQPGREGREAFFERCLEVLCDTFGRLGVAVERVGEQDVWSAGRKLLGSGGATIGSAQVFGASLLERFDANGFARCIACPSEGYRAWLGELLSEGVTDLARQGVRADESQLIAALREACSAHWRVEDAAVGTAAVRAVETAAEELREPLESGGRRLVRNGIKINRRTYLLEDAAPPWLRLVWRDGCLARAASGDADVEQALERCLGEPLREGAVSCAARAHGLTREAAAGLEARVLTLCRDAGR